MTLIEQTILFCKNLVQTKTEDKKDREIPSIAQKAKVAKADVCCHCALFVNTDYCITPR